MRRRKPLAPLGVAALLSAIALASCAQSEAIIARDLGDAATAPTNTFTPPPDGGDAQALPAPPAQLCVATECPAAYTTCPTTPDGISYFKCQINLLTDNDNCGECGHVCQDFPEFGTGTRCVSGVCTASCNDPERRDCNAIPDDGCEVNIRHDSQNCGGCENACGPGVRCVDGQCGCPGGMLDCAGECVDPSTDNSHCGGCGNACEAPADAADIPYEFHLVYTCQGGHCGQFTCLHNLDGARDWWTDCNNDRTSDGCEINLAVPDQNNCGACGKVCAPGQPCHVVDESTTPPSFACGCAANETKCGEELGYGPDVFTGCANLLTDVENCGACSHKCKDPYTTGPHRIHTCNQGLCESECQPGWGDCNGIPGDGCETNLTVDPAHCGACGTSCDLDAGQPCIDGRCLTEACEGDAGPVTK